MFRQVTTTSFVFYWRIFHKHRSVVQNSLTDNIHVGFDGHRLCGAVVAGHERCKALPRTLSTGVATGKWPRNVNAWVRVLSTLKCGLPRHKHVSITGNDDCDRANRIEPHMSLTTLRHMEETCDIRLEIGSLHGVVHVVGVCHTISLEFG